MIRVARPADRTAIAAFVSGVRPAAAAGVLAALDDGFARLLLEGEKIIGVVCFARVALATAGYEISWLIVEPGDGAIARVTRLLDAVRNAIANDASAHVRFIGGAAHRGGADPHLLDAAGLERRGRVPDFYGPEDDLFVFAATFIGEATLPLEPTSPEALYDAAFGYRDFSAEREFLLTCARVHGERPVRRIASWACASGRHVHAFADIGIEGLGIDDNAELCELARRLSSSFRDTQGVDFRVAPLDARVAAPEVDLSFTMLSAIHRLTSESAIAAHLDAAAALLGVGGVHVIEATHPSDLDVAHAKTVAWTELRGRFAVHSRFNLDVHRRASDGTQAATLDVRCTDTERNAVVATLQQHERWLVPEAADWERIVSKSGRFAIAAMLGDFHLDVGCDQPGAWRMILVLRRVR
jgi:hypothetical protein